MKKIKNILFFCGCIFVSSAVTAQNTNLQNELKKGNQLRLAYKFEEALDIFSPLLQQNSDSVFQMEILREITLCENGKNMLNFTSAPKVIAYKTVLLKEFYRYYDLSLPGFWSLTPSPFLQASPNSEINPFIYLSSKNPEVIYFDTYNPEGHTGWDIYETHRMPNNEWSAPERFSETVNTSFDERFPYLCPDGRTLYFASNGHYGMGGYDLYKTVKDPVTGEWSRPENLGFPLSSTGDDILYVPDADNLYACFASTRNAGKDSITVYKIALEGTPVKQPLRQWANIVKMAALQPAAAPVSGKKTADNVMADAGPEAAYYRQVQELQKIKQQNSSAQADLNQLRADYAKTTDTQERKILAIKIDVREQTLQQYQQEIQQLTKEIQELEISLLMQGIVVSSTAMPKETGTEQAVVPISGTLSPRPEKIYLLPEPVVQAPIVAVSETKDFTLRTKTETLVFDNEQVDGISYRYQVGVFSKKPDVKIFKGFSPVFIDVRNGKWVCSIGSFRTHNEAQQHSSIIKRDFKDAILTAYKNSKPVDLKTARAEEGKTAGMPVNKNAAYQIMLGETLPDNLHKAVQKATSKEVARTVVNGKTQYMVGPYNTKEEADKVVALLQQSGFNTVNLVTVERP